MKKGVLVGIGVFALMVVMWWADKKFPAANRPAVTTTSSNATDASMAAVPLKDLNDHPLTLGQYKGQVVLVNFWATWCEPCKAEIPLLIEFQKKYGPRGFTVLGISMDEEGKKAVSPFLEKERFDVDGQQVAMDYPITIGSDSIADQFGGVIGLPTSMLFTRDGKKILTILGPINIAKDRNIKAIEDAL